MKTPTTRPRRAANPSGGLFPASETRTPAPPPAATPDARPRHVNLFEIPLIGGPLPPGTMLIETARIPAQTIRVPVGDRGAWGDLEIGERVNLQTEDKRTVSDYPIVRLAMSSAKLSG